MQPLISGEAAASPVSTPLLSIKYKQRSDLATGLCLFTMVLNFY